MFLLKELSQCTNLLERTKRHPEPAPLAATAVFMQLMGTCADLAVVFTLVHASHRLSHGRFNIMLLLYCEPDRARSPVDLAAQANVSPATMTGLVHRLERDGLVRREKAACNRRLRSVRLTAKGRSRFARVFPDFLRRVVAVVEGLTVADRSLLIRLLEKIDRTLPMVAADLAKRKKPQRNFPSAHSHA